MTKQKLLPLLTATSLLVTGGLLIEELFSGDGIARFSQRSYQLTLLALSLIDINLLLLLFNNSGRRKKTNKEGFVDSGRRSFLTWSSGIAQNKTVDAVKQKMDKGIAAVTKKRNPKSRNPLVPAGAGTWEHYKKACDVCQKCVEICPQKVLKPSLAYADFMLPELDFRSSYCHVDCVKCNEVCPTGALEKITPEEKAGIQIGYAVWLRENCLVIDDKQCSSCEKACPNGSIEMIASGRFKIPLINTGTCLGCGACQAACPSSPLKAIYVEAHLSHRYR